MNNIEEISQNRLCVNCGACKAACPKNAITFAYSNIGRMYANINHDSCVDCGLCRKVCPALNFEELYSRMNDPYNGTIINTYIIHSSYREIYVNAQSGGLCTATIKYLFDKNLIDTAIVCQADVGENPSPKAVIVKDTTQLMRTQKSNYTPVDILSVMKELNGNERVALVGLPCHIKASVLLAEKIKKYDIIKYRLGLVCDRTLCYNITKVMGALSGLQKYKVYWRKKHAVNGKHIYSYREAPVVVVDENDKDKKVFPNRYRMVLKDMFTAPHCRLCYDKVNVYSDIVYGDPWCLDNVDWYNGDSLVLTRTPKGDFIIDKLIEDGYVENVRKIDKQDALDGQFVYERRERFPQYVCAFREVFKDTIANSIYNAIPFKEGEFVNTAKNEFKSFVKAEKLSEEEILLRAKEIIRKEKKNILLSHFKSSVKSIIKRIIQKL